MSPIQAAEAKNIPVMLQALANKADINWRNVADQSKTSLIKAVESVSCSLELVSEPFIFKRKNSSYSLIGCFSNLASLRSATRMGDGDHVEFGLLFAML